MTPTTHDSPAHLPPAPRSRGGCCCGIGCLTMFGITIAGVVLLAVGGWWFVGKTLSTFTSDAPIAVQMQAPNEEQFASASTKLETLRTATGARQVTRVELTAEEINALIARHPSFTDLRGKMRVAMSDSIMTLDLSVPLDDVPLPGMNNRWFNGSIRFGLIYDDDRFALAVKSLNTNGQEVDLGGLRSLADTINDSFNEGFNNSQRDNPQENEFWDNVRSIEILGGKLIITTKGAETVAALHQAQRSAL